jgi:hypothetical protein
MGFAGHHQRRPVISPVHWPLAPDQRRPHALWRQCGAGTLACVLSLALWPSQIISSVLSFARLLAGISAAAGFVGGGRWRRHRAIAAGGANSC